jgi:hypothetical protein
VSLELGFNPQQAVKGQEREPAEHPDTWPKDIHATVLSKAEEAAIIGFGRHSSVERLPQPYDFEG